VVGLGAAALVHGMWLRGSSWPAADREKLADLVVGRRPFPGPGATSAVTVLLGAATAVTAVRAGLLPLPGGRSAGPVRVAAKILVATLVARGAGGLVVSGLGLGDVTPEFRRWDIRLYSPYCLALGLAVALASRSELR